MNIYALVKRGKHEGKMLLPHRHKDGMYVVSATRFEKDYIRVETLDEVLKYISEGYSARMSNLDEGVAAASLIAPSAISVSA
jgi:hypothetical protein